MKKVLFIILVVMLLVAFAATVFADQKATPNDNAEWGQIHKEIAEAGSVSEAVHGGQDYAESLYMNFGQLIKMMK